jgi:histidyl-tRNA synthetase
MNTYGSLPAPSAPADIMIIVVGEQNATYALAIAKQLRENTKMLAGIPTSRISVDISGRKIGDQIKAADKRGIPHIIVIGDEETKSGALKIKTLASGVEAPLSL